ncbi:MAG TPA: Uma2 family endonuclease [Burkholderiales bacterium]|nr:Uma2 family endonuclease [Burkholderiales bacterium]
MKRKIRHAVADIQEVIEAPLSGEELGMRYRALCEDPCYAKVPGKIELDLWGRMVMTPASNYHSAIQTRLTAKLAAVGGQAFVEASVLTTVGVLVVDAAWASAAFMSLHGFETPYTRAPQLCIEVVSPSNSRKELNEKIAAYLEAGAEEVWLVYPQSKRCEFYAQQGQMPRSAYVVELGELFD